MQKYVLWEPLSFHSANIYHVWLKHMQLPPHNPKNCLQNPSQSLERAGLMPEFRYCLDSSGISLSAITQNLFSSTNNAKADQKFAALFRSKLEFISFCLVCALKSCSSQFSAGIIAAIYTSWHFSFSIYSSSLEASQQNARLQRLGERRFRTEWRRISWPWLMNNRSDFRLPFNSPDKSFSSRCECEAVKNDLQQFHSFRARLGEEEWQ